jgi:integrase
MHRVLKKALKQAVRWKKLNANPADNADPPKVEPSTMQIYDIEQTIALIEALRGSRMLIPALLAVLCGLRRGEIAALRWGRVTLKPDRFPWSRVPSNRALASVTSGPSLARGERSR